jgi:cell division septation protein DedD
MGLKADQFENVNNNFANVTFEITDGALTIEPAELTVKANSITKTYGNADPAMTVTSTGLKGSDVIIPITTREAGENVGEYAIAVEVAPDRNYTITTEPGVFTIIPREVTVTADNRNKIYGTEDPELTMTVDGLAEGDSIELITGTANRAAGEDVGEYEISVEGEELQGNYKVTYVSGSLKILPEDTVLVTITGNKATYQYDGTEKTVAGYTVEIENSENYTEDDIEFQGNESLTETNAGTYAMGLTEEDFTNRNSNFTNVVFQVKDGELTITRRQVTLTSGDASKQYDGTALFTDEDSVQVSGDGFAEGEGASYIMTGRITSEGTTENKFNYILNDDTLEGNYDITTVFGTLTVTPAPVSEENTTEPGTEQQPETQQPETQQPETQQPETQQPEKTKTVVDAVTGEARTETVTTTNIPTEFSAKDHVRLTAFVGSEQTTDNGETVTTVKAYNDFISIDGYGTPLGIAESILGNGESIE